MKKDYPRSYMDITFDMHKSLLTLQHILLEKDASSKLREIDVILAYVLALRAELTMLLDDALLAEAIYSIVYRCAMRPSLHAFIYTLNYFSEEVRGSGQAAIPRYA